MSWRNLFDPLIKDVEGYSEQAYTDSKGNPTVGPGMNLNDDTIKGLLNIRGINPEDVISGQRQLSPEEIRDVHNQYLGKREQLVRGQLGKDLYDTLKPNEQASLMSMGYQSLNNLGPSLTGRLAADDKIGAMREMILNTNKDKDPGILRRRLKEAEMYGGPLDFTSTFKTMSPEEKKQLRDIIDSIDNEHTKQETLSKYGSYLTEPQPSSFNKLQQLLQPKLGK